MPFNCNPCAGYAPLPGSPGPLVTVTLPVGGKVLVSVTAQVFGNANSTSCAMSYSAPGVTASDATAVILAGSAQQRATATSLVTITGNPGDIVTITAQYANEGTGNLTCTWSNRAIVAIPLPGAVTE